MTTQTNGNTGVSRVQGGAVNGVADSSSAPTGFVGERVYGQRLLASPLAMTTGVSAGIASITLTAGDWDVQGRVGLVTAATTTVGTMAAWIDTTISSLLNDREGTVRVSYLSQVPNTGGTGSPVHPTGVTRISLSGTTTVYLVGYASFGTSTLSLYGDISARRVR